MRTLIAAALVVANGTGETRIPVPCPVDIVAQDEAEADWLRARLKGKHHAKSIGVKLAGRAAA